MSDSSTLPAFLNNVYPLPGAIGEIKARLCAQLNVAELWEPGDAGNTMSRIDPSFQFQLDGVVVPRGDTEFYSTGPRFFIEAQGQQGSYPGLTVICTEINLLPGMHEAHVQIESSSGILYSYKWNFRADAVIPNSEDNNRYLTLNYVLESSASTRPGE